VKSRRNAYLVLFFLALVGAEIGHGMYRLNALSERQRERWVESIEREHDDLAKSLRARIDGQSEHAAYLSALPLTREVARSGGSSDVQRKELEAELLPFLLAFRGLDRIRVLSNEGREIVRCERIGQGGRWASALPPGRLSQSPDETALDLVRGVLTSRVMRSTLLVDRDRVEVPESERLVLHYATPIIDKHQRLGILFLTVYASPILHRVREFAPFEGTQSFVVDSDGSYLAHHDREKERGRANPGNVFRDFSELPSDLGTGTNHELPDRVLRSTSISETPSWKLLTTTPESSLRSASVPLRGEYAWVIAGTAAMTIALIILAIVFTRLSIRELRLQEAKRQEALKEQLEISERLGSLGLVTAGVAHEINNPLEGIGNYLALLEKKSLPTEKRMRYLRLLKEGFDRIRDIVRDLQDTARPTVGDGTADLKIVADQALKLALYDKKFKRIEVLFEGFDEPIVAAGDAGRLQQVFLNLFLNAGRALGGQGKVWVVASPVSRDADGRRWVDIAVEDDGPGIPPENLGKIFDPFFTTSDGTGLGLAISFSIVKAHGGNLSAANRPQGGASLRLRLPVAGASTEPASENTSE